MSVENDLRNHLRKAAVELRDARQRMAQLEHRRTEPVAIVGMACRLPGGVVSADDLWELLAAGGDAVGPFPADRGWDLGNLFDPDPDAVGKTYVSRGGFLADVAGFDAGFFGISPREALAMDPQQRLLLESSWEALEHAGIDPLSLAGSRTGVFTGVSMQDYTALVGGAATVDEGYLGTGAATSVVSGRVAYVLGMEGPAVTVDSACSSSLVALHLAAQSLRSGESNLALAGGASVMSTPMSFVAFSRQRGLAVDGRVKAFADAADGTAWGEGVGVLVLERLSDAVAHGRRVLAVVRGSAVNSDGASSGLSAPNGPSQQRVITRALASGGLTVGDVDVVEGHGTGTRLGDPIEAQALLGTYGRDRGGRGPLWLGSVKSNVGHTQAAAGVAGVIKMVLALERGVLPATLHVDVPSSHVEWESGAVRLLTEAQSWVRGSRVRRAGVSAFGVSGTNAHVIIEEAPAVEPVEAGGSGMSGPVVWPLSAGSVVGVGRQAARLARWVRARPGVPVVDVAWSLGESRAALGYRAVVVGSDEGELLAGLDGLVAGGQATKADVGSGVVWVFPGQGGQWVGMGAVLLAESAVFAAVIAECEAVFGDDVEWSLSEVLRTGVGLDRVDVVQPALFAVMVALGRLWGSCGVVPDAVVGHSQGEIAAAVVAGGLSLVDGARVVVRRSRALLAVAGDAGMVSITAPLETVVPLLGEGVSVAAVNGPESVVVSGPSAALDVVVGVLTERGVWARRIEVDYAAHSAAVEPLRERLLAELADLTPTSGEIPFYSTVTGGLVDTAGLDAGYWYRNLRETVRFEDTIRGLVEGGHRTLIEISPHPVLGLGMQSTLEALEVSEAVVLDTLRRDEGGLSRFLGAMGKAYAHGVAVDWAALYPNAHPVSLPTYAFDHHHYWPETPAGLQATGASPLSSAAMLELSWTAASRVEDGPPASQVVLGTGLGRPEDPHYPGLSALVAALDAGAPAPETVLVAVSEYVAADGAEAPALAVLAVDAVAALLSEWLGEPRLDAARLVLYTRDAVATDADEAVDPGWAAVWGLLRCAQAEHPDRFALVDSDTGELSDAVVNGRHEQAAVRAGAVLVPALVPVPDVAAAPVRAGGGTLLLAGNVDPAIAAHLVARHAPEHVVVGGAEDGAPELDVPLTIVHADLSDRAAAARILDAVPDEHPLRAVVCAGDVETAWHLHLLTADTDLTAFVLLGSAAGVLGGAGRAVDGATAAFHAALAQLRRHEGLPALTLLWRPEEKAADPGRPWPAGTAPVAGPDLLAVLDRADRAGRPTVTVLGVDPSAPRGTAPFLLRHLLPAPAGAAATVGLRDTLAGRPAAEQEHALRTMVAARAAAVLGHADSSALRPEQPFAEVGFDSLTAVELRNRLAVETGLRLPATLLFDHPNIDALAQHLREKLFGAAPAVASAPAGPATIGADDPIAIVGMACRIPGGVETPEDFWDLLARGRDGMREFPTDRGWKLDELFDPDPDVTGTSYARHGGFVSDIAGFDAGFFGISPREALAMDPQQRLLLESSWHALEHAGIPPTSLSGSRTGVFAGVATGDYGLVADEWDEGYLTTSGAGSVVSGRVAYALGLVGPAVSVDTACSSSLVAAHLAARSLRSGECDTALAGGVTVMATPSAFVAFSRQRGLAADGQVKAFADAADGTAWGEGVGVLVLQRLSDAVTAGRRIWGVIRGSAVNSDGASNGLSAPNGPSQQRVIRDALAGAGLTPRDVDAVEAHGTGTALGDPVEAQALLATYGQDRSGLEPLLLGSVKSNVGHTQAAAGVVGVIKMVLALQHELLPATLHVEAPSSHVDWESGAVRLLTEAQAWPRAQRVRRAGVSSFGVSGTNAHLIVEQPPEPLAAPNPVAAPGPGLPGGLWTVSGRGEAGMRAQAERVAAWVRARPDLPPAEVAAALATTRSALPDRAAVTGADRDELLRGLDLVASAEPRSAAASPHGAVVSGSPVVGATVVLFPGQGSQFPGMGAGLEADFPVFAGVFGEICAEFDSVLERPLRDVLLAADPELAGLLDETVYTQAGLFAVEVALYRLLESWGLRPDVVGGHSIGEVAAAHVAGVFDLADACRLVAARGAAMQTITTPGAMSALGIGEQELGELPAGVELTAVNTAGGVVVGGDPDGVTVIEQRCRERGRTVKRLRVNRAFHTGHLDPVLDRFRAALDGITFHSPELSVLSNASGALAEPRAIATPEYWVTQARSTVRFAEDLDTVAARGAARCLEIGPGHMLTRMVAGHLDGIVGIASLAEDRPATAAVRELVARWHVSGGEVDWAAVYPGIRPVELPGYPFQHQRFWPVAGPPRVGDLTAAGLDAAMHPLLGAVTELAEDRAILLSGRLSATEHPWLADHVMFERSVVPSAVFLDLAHHAGRRAGCSHLERLAVETPLVLPPSGELRLQVRVSAPVDGRCEISIHARAADADPDAACAWTRYAFAQATAGPSPAPGSPAPSGDRPPAGTAVPAFDDADRARDGAVVERLWRDRGVVHVEVALAEGVEPGGYGLHPALLDAALAAAGHTGPAGDAVRWVTGWRGITVHATGARWLRARLRAGDTGEVDIWLVDADGQTVATIDGASTATLTDADLPAPPAGDGALHELSWFSVSAGEPLTHTAVLGDGAYPDIAALGDALNAGAPAPQAVLAPLAGLVAVPDSDLAARTHHVAAAVLELLQSWLADPRVADLTLVVGTAGAVATGAAEHADPVWAPVWGLVRAAQTEHPGRFVLADGPDPAAMAAAAATGHPQVAVRGEVPYVPRLTQHRATETDSEAAGSPWDPDGTVLITGGPGLLGAALARHLVATRPDGHVLLASRRGAAGATALLAELGQRVDVVTCDVTDRAAVTALLDAVPPRHPLTAVVHLAGVLDDGVVESVSTDRLAGVLAPKVDGAWHLHELTRDRDLAGFVLFSSISGILGGPGQASYAAANLFLDAFAEYRRAQGLPAVSLAWGRWEQAGGFTAALTAADLARSRRAGLGALSTERALVLFDAAIGSSAPVLVPMAVHRSAAGADPEAVPALLHELVPTRLPRVSNTPAAQSRFADLGDADLDRALRELVSAEAAVVLGHTDTAAITSDRPFADLGFDSLTAVDLRNRVAAVTGLRLPAALLFDHPTPDLLIRELRDRLRDRAPERRAPQASAQPSAEPIAIVGMACRLPGGVASPDDLWELLADRGDGIVAFPRDRGWDIDGLYDPDPDAAGRSYVREGGFLDDVAGFDAGFFDIGPREALAMDPQQRLLLETSWAAVEDAGIDPLSLAGTSTGVYTGFNVVDYPALSAGGSNLDEGYLATSGSGSVVSGRVAYHLGLQGPAVSVDTACSSSLVAMHLAAQSLRTGECDTALAGGATVLSTPTGFVAFSRQRGLAADGRCKAFADTADGTGWGEGVVVVVLERLSSAVANGHRIHGLIRGSALNQDGASNGLSAPNGPAQQRVIAQALANADLGPADIDAVEAHGTGTALGDPIEAEALHAVYGRDRDPERPLWLGSVKSNIGHTQAAAGAAGLVKMVLALRHGTLPATLHVDEPSSRVDWSSGAVRLLTEPRPWAHADGAPRRAAISAFGVSGTNAHLILEEPPNVPESAGELRAPDGPSTWLLSARSSAGLAGQAERLAARLRARPELGSADVALTLAASRAHLPVRAAVSGADRDRMLAALDRLAEGAPAPGVVTGRAAAGPVAWVFPGQGGQWPGMAARLLDESAVFAEAIADCAAALDPYLDRLLTEVLRTGDGLDQVDIVQPALFAVMVALARVWTACGVVPDAVAGHSQGEIAAAVVAGALSLADGARVVALRSRALQAVTGAMASVAAPEDTVLTWMRAHGSALSIAAVNGPTTVVVSGSTDAVATLVEECVARGVRATRMPVSYAAHSAAVEPLAEDLLAGLAGITPRASAVPFYSGVTGAVIDTTQLDAAYWYRNLRETVRFAQVAQTLVADGHRSLVEVGPHPVLSAGLHEIAEAAPAPVAVCATLHRDEGGLDRMVAALGAAHVAGVEVDWPRALAGRDARVIDLPTYPFQHRRFWPATTATAETTAATPVRHPLLDPVVSCSDGGAAVFTGQLSAAAHSWLREHVVFGHAVFPASGFLDLIGTVGRYLSAPTVHDLVLERPLLLGDTGELALRVRVDGPDGANRALAVHTRAGDDLPWIRHATATLVHDTGPAPEPRPETTVHGAWPPVQAVAVATATLYDDLAARGVEYGPTFRAIRAIWRDGDTVHGELVLPDGAGGPGHADRLHPALLDAAGQLAFAFGADGAGLPFRWGTVRLAETTATRLRVRLNGGAAGPHGLVATDESGLVIATLTDIVSRPVTAEQWAVLAADAGGRDDGAGADRRAELSALSDASRGRLLTTLVADAAAAVLGHTDGGAIDPARPLTDQGFDSLTAVALRTRLNDVTGLRLPTTVVFDHATVTALARHLAAELSGGASGAEAAHASVARRAVAVDEPIAIVGMSCRYPGGADSVAGLWDLVASGSDATSEFPTDRGWDLDTILDPDPATRGTSYVSRGGFLADVAGFDAGFFGISPREALAMDPQQRLLLESSWEALEHAGIDPLSLAGSRTGVFTGVAAPDYGLGGQDIDWDEGYLATGRLSSVVSGRVAYQLGLEGPAVSVDTACSSSLVALHLAAQSLRSGECDLALAGGVAVLATPTGFVVFSRQRGLAVDGRVKAFADAADGTAWGEGVGLVVLQRLSDAVAAGQRVLAVVRGSAVNQDGASNGLSAPSGPSQQRVIREALSSGGLTVGDVDVVEGHGTGTRLGDPIEAQALLGTYGRDRGGRGPLWLGSVKSNVGHTQAAAGVAGVIKMVLALERGVLPATLHVDVPSSHVEWESGAVRLLTEAQSWVRGSRVRRAGVSAFGVSGTNAHVIIEEAPAVEPVEAGGSGMSGPVVWPLSAGSVVGVGRQAARLARWVRARPGVPVVDVAWSLGESRAALGYRAVVVGSDEGELLAGLDGLVAGGQATKADVGSGVVWVFPGQGGQWVGMGAVLLAESAVFAAVIAECEAVFGDDVEWSLSEVLRTGVGLDRVDVVQPALFAVMVALGRLWGSCGVVPDAVVGHSQGEIAAAVVAGGLSLVDGARVVVRRSRALLAVAGDAGMVSITAPLETVVPLLPDDVSVAAVNGPESVVVSGPSAALDVVVGVLTERGVWARRIEVDYAAHSAAVEPLRERLLAELADLTPTSGEIPFYSTVTGGLVDTAGLDAGYWYRNLRETVRFEDTIRGLVEGGHRTLIEVSPHPVLGLGMQSTLEALEVSEAVVLDTLRRDEGGLSRFLGAVGKAYAHGVAVDWAALYPNAHPVSLPTYAFDHQRYWLAGRVGGATGSPDAFGWDNAEHPLLGAAVPLAEGDGLLLTGRLSLAEQPWLADHTVLGRTLFPATAFVELVRHAGSRVDRPYVAELVLYQPLVLPSRGEVHVQVRLAGADEDGRCAVSVHSRTPGEQQSWVRHATATVGPEPVAPIGDDAIPSAWPPPGAEVVPAAGAYADLAARGFAYGPSFQGVRAVWRDGDTVYGELVLPDNVAGDAGAFGIHPALFDAVLQLLFASAADGTEVRLPFAWNGVAVHRTGALRLRATVTSTPSGGVSIQAHDENGAAVLSVAELDTRVITASQLGDAPADEASLLELGWRPAPDITDVPGGPEPMPAVLGPCPSAWADLIGWPDQAALCASLDDGGDVPATVLAYLPAWLDGAEVGDVPQAARRVVAITLDLIQQWLAEPRLIEPRLVLCTRGALAVRNGETPDPAVAALWGLVRTAQIEHPGRFVLADLDPAPDSAPALVAAVAHALPQLAVRDGVVLAPALTPSPQPDDTADWLPGGSVLITGADTALAAVVAREVTDRRGAGCVVLASPTGAVPPGLDGLSARVLPVACDLSDRAAVAGLLAAIPDEHPLTAVVHLAGALDDGVVEALTPERFEPVLEAKVDGAWHLHELTRDLGLAGFVLFSSSSGLLGSPGQANDAAANAVLDALAGLRQANGLCGTALAWGQWEQTEDDDGVGEADRARLRRAGVGMLGIDEGMAVFDAACVFPHPMLAPIRLDRAALRTLATTGDVPFLLRELAPSAPARTATGAEPVEDAADLAARLVGRGEADQERIVLDIVSAEVAAVLGYGDGAAIDASRGLLDLGFDSLTAVELRNRLNRRTGLRLPATVVFDHPSTAELARYVRSELIGDEFEQVLTQTIVNLDTLADALTAGGDQQQRLRRRIEAMLRGWEDTGTRDDPSALSDAASAEDLVKYLDELVD